MALKQCLASFILSCVCVSSLAQEPSTSGVNTLEISAIETSTLENKLTQPVVIQYLPAMGCMIEPSMRVDISSPVPGVIDSVSVKLGDKVRKGQPIFSLKSGVEAASVELAKVRSEFAQRQVERNDSLYNEDLISIHERDEFATEYQVSQKELRHSREVLDLRKIKSPINGVVIDLFNESGEFVGTDPVLTLARLDPLKVELVMPYESFGSISAKGSLTIYPEAPINGQYQAKITMVDPIIDAASGTYRIRAELANPKGELPAGIKCLASL
jgi:RND family efflux transporter MFP subunit